MQTNVVAMVMMQTEHGTGKGDIAISLINYANATVVPLHPLQRTQLGSMCCNNHQLSLVNPNPPSIRSDLGLHCWKFSMLTSEGSGIADISRRVRHLKPRPLRARLHRWGPNGGTWLSRWPRGILLLSFVVELCEAREKEEGNE